MIVFLKAVASGGTNSSICSDKFFIKVWDPSTASIKLSCFTEFTFNSSRTFFNAFLSPLCNASVIAKLSFSLFFVFCATSAVSSKISSKFFCNSLPKAWDWTLNFPLSWAEALVISLITLGCIPKEVNLATFFLIQSSTGSSVNLYLTESAPLFKTLNAPPIVVVSKAPSPANFNLFKSSLVASSLPSASCSFLCVGPKPIASPIVPNSLSAKT